MMNLDELRILKPLFALKRALEQGLDLAFHGAHYITRSMHSVSLIQFIHHVFHSILGSKSSRVSIVSTRKSPSGFLGPPLQ